MISTVFLFVSFSVVAAVLVLLIGYWGIKMFCRSYPEEKAEESIWSDMQGSDYEHESETKRSFLCKLFWVIGWNEEQEGIAKFFKKAGDLSVKILAHAIIIPLAELFRILPYGDSVSQDLYESRGELIFKLKKAISCCSKLMYTAQK